MARHQSPLAVIVKGALAGAAGTAVMGAFRQRAPQLLGALGAGRSEPPATPVEVADADEASRWALGAGWGAYFAVIQSTFRPWPPLHGVLLGGLMTFVAVRVGRPLSLAPAPRTREELTVTAASHVVFGVVAALVYQVLNLGRRG